MAYNSGVHPYALRRPFYRHSVSLSLRHENLTLLRPSEFISVDAVDIAILIFCIRNNLFRNYIRVVHWAKSVLLLNHQAAPDDAAIDVCFWEGAGLVLCQKAVTKARLQYGVIDLSVTSALRYKKIVSRGRPRNS